MKKTVLFIVVLFATGVLKAASPDTAPPRDVLAHSSGDWSWFAHVTKAPGLVLPGDPNAVKEQTDCYALQNAPGQQWRPLATVPGRVVALASRSSQLAVLMADGEWFTVWNDGSATGQPLPAKGKITAFTDDGSHLWALGLVNGGLAEANRAIVEDAASTQPTTVPYGTELSSLASTRPNDPIIPRSMLAKTVVFRENNGHWETVAELDPSVMLTGDQEVSLTVVGDQPLVSVKTDPDKVRTVEFTSEHVWKDIGWPTYTDHQSVASFRILTDGFKPILWWTTGNSSGELVPEGFPEKHLPLAWPSGDALDGVPTATFAGGYVCVFGPHGTKVLEQRYQMNATAIDTAAEVTVVKDLTDSLLPHWLEVVFLTSMGFSVGASVFRQWSEPAKGPVVVPPVAAPLVPRFAAGLIDAIPLIAAVAYIAFKTDALNDLNQIAPLKAALILIGAMALYVLHTTLVEVFTGRSAGKWVFGLKVVTLQDEAPTRSQLVIRNLLRVIDPLIMIIISPQRQRSADAIANTMVVPLEPLPQPVDEPDDD